MLAKITMQKCTYPDCPASLQEWISESHCQTYHNMSKKELQEIHGKIEDKEYTIGNNKERK